MDFDADGDEEYDAVAVVVVVADDDDDSFEDPDSGPCAFPVPAFNGGHFFLLVGCWFFTLSLLPNFLLLSVLLPPH